MTKRASQPKLPGTSTRRKVGTVERHAGADVRELKALDVLPPGTSSLQAVYRALGRTFDEAVDGDDRYGRINTARELLRVREALAPVAMAAGGMSIEEMISEVNAE